MSSNGYVKFTWFLLRIVSGFTFFQSGAVKLFGWYGGMPAGQPPIQLLSQVGIGAILEVVGGIAIVLGLATRPVAFLLSGEMAVAYWQFHYWPNGGWPGQNQGIPAVLMCFIFLFMAAQGGGDLSLDGMIRRKRGTP